MDEMNPKFIKLMKKKEGEGKKMSSSHKRAKGDVLKHLMSEMDDMGAETLQGAKKVSVMADSKEGLEKGLEKAKEIVEQKVPSEDEESEEMEESEDSEEESREELKAKIAELKAKLEQLEG